MADQNDKAFSRPMFKGDWTCAQCGAKIPELPFEPDATRPVYCRECNQARKRA